MATHALTVDYTAADRTLRVAGEIDMLSADEFRGAIATATCGLTEAITVNLSEVTYCSSAAVGVLVKAMNAVDLRVVAREGSVAHRVLDTCGVAHVVEPSG